MEKIQGLQTKKPARERRCAGTAGSGRWRNAGGERMREDEQRDFLEFLDRLRHAKDKAEFDQFMSDRSRRPQGPEPQPQPQS